MWGVNSSKKDDKFYEDLCEKYFEHVYKYCKYLVKGQNQLLDFAEECTQQTFLEARKQLSKLADHPNPQGWLYKTAKNLINNSYRTMYIKKRHEVFIDDDLANTLQSTDIDFEKILDQNIEDLDTLAADVLKKVSKHEYELYTDYYKERKSISELSNKYDVSATAITTRIYRLKRKIRKIVHDHFILVDT